MKNINDKMKEIFTDIKCAIYIILILIAFIFGAKLLITHGYQMVIFAFLAIYLLWIIMFIRAIIREIRRDKEDK